MIEIHATRAIWRWLPFAVLGLCLGALTAGAQELEELVDEEQRAEEELRKIPGTGAPGLLPEELEDRVRLPEGEEVQRLNISQDREIDPDAYIVGPGDVLQLYIWGEFDQDIPFEINPEGFANVPTIGSFNAIGRTLNDVRAEITEAAQSDKYPGVEITLTLQSMRFFTVYVTGAVLNTEQAYTVTPITRVTHLINIAGGFRGAQSATAKRSVKVIHQDGTVEVADLAMFLATGNIKLNPYLRMGDVVHVGFRRHEIFAYGSLNQEGDHEFRPGDTVGDLLLLARGISGSAPISHAEVWRFVGDTDSTSVIPLVASPPDGETRYYEEEDIAHFPLQPKDMLFVRTPSDWRQTPTVHAHGQFLYVGRYRVVPGQTTLTDFVDQAGGFTRDANLLEARVIRTKYRAVKDPEFERLKRVQAVSGLADMSPEERAYLKSKEREERGRLSIDFDRLFTQGDSTQNVVLEGGDVIFVPKKRQTVSLSGQFVKPGLVDFADGRRVNHYIQQAGGFAFDAHKRGARLIRARTGQRQELNMNLIVEAGDEIWVPEKEYRDWVDLVQGIIRSSAEALTLILLVRAI
ncbi:MAG: SLBB domain-containing protein [Candidatus Latescibacterota bacterium]|nr:SLBB domain-containing protein [Candidatus Latescibacterota bacterium]